LLCFGFSTPSRTNNNSPYCALAELHHDTSDKELEKMFAKLESSRALANLEEDASNALLAFIARHWRVFAGAAN
jgi:hypothetical protein